MFSLSATRMGNIELLIRGFNDINMERNNYEVNFGSVIAMLGCPVAVFSSSTYYSSWSNGEVKLKWINAINLLQKLNWNQNLFAHITNHYTKYLLITANIDWHSPKQPSFKAINIFIFFMQLERKPLRTVNRIFATSLRYHKFEISCCVSSSFVSVISVLLCSLNYRLHFLMTWYDICFSYIVFFSFVCNCFLLFFLNRYNQSSFN